ncbi:ABC transporter substrate-binding protein [Ralstonia sp. 24A2]|uniref:ABC transporter substrate-binding protein n=1 Tax=Ralstonia sp. 24A2 TaxID=3447364 RepID=UPI003F6991E8
MDRRQFMRGAATLAGGAMVVPIARAAEPGVHTDKIIFGQSIGFNSIWDGVYRNYTNGLLAYFNHVNMLGGVHGRKLELKHLEDEYVPEKTTAANIRAFVGDDVFGLACLGGTGNTAAALPLIERYRFPVVGTLTGAEAVRKATAPLFHTRAPYSSEVARMIQQATTVGLKRVAVVHQDNAFGMTCVQAAQGGRQRSAPTSLRRFRTAFRATTLTPTSPADTAELNGKASSAKTSSHQRKSGRMNPPLSSLADAGSSSFGSLFEGFFEGFKRTQKRPLLSRRAVERIAPDRLAILDHPVLQVDHQRLIGEGRDVTRPHKEAPLLGGRGRTVIRRHDQRYLACCALALEVEGKPPLGRVQQDRVLTPLNFPDRGLTIAVLLKLRGGVCDLILDAKEKRGVGAQSDDSRFSSHITSCEIMFRVGNMSRNRIMFAGCQNIIRGGIAFFTF